MSEMTVIRLLSYCHILRFPEKRTYLAKVYHRDNNSPVAIDHPMRKHLEKFKRDGHTWPDVLELAPGMPIMILLNINFESTTLIISHY